MRHRFEYWVIRVVTLTVQLLPWPVVHAAGTALGLAFYALDATHRRITLTNLASAFPARSEQERSAIGRAVFAHFGRLLVELLKFSTLTPAEMMTRVEFEGEERGRQAYAHGHGVFFLTGHFGYWEICGIVHAVKLAPIGVMARALDNPHLNRLLEHVRECTGNTVIYRRGALRRVLRMLEANQGVAILIDQHSLGPEAVSVQFFNRRAATASTLAVMALRAGTPVIPVFAIPTGPGRYRMIYEHPVQMPGPDSPDAVLELTQRCTDVLEMYVRRYPELWLWMHRRWRDDGAGAAEERVRGMFPAAARDTDADPNATGGEP